jgi:hypothetical protein
MIDELCFSNNLSSTLDTKSTLSVLLVLVSLGSDL